MTIFIHAILFKGDFMNAIELGKFLAKLRSEKNLTQEELADKLFIDKRKISRWECGTSTPEFEMLIKISDILDVSLFELSICKRIDNVGISRSILNKFKSIKDFKRYKLKKKLFIIVIIILIVIFAITFVYTIRSQGTIEIYELQSMNDNYFIKGNYIKYKDNSIISITNIGDNLNKRNYLNSDCHIEIYNDDKRVSYVFSENESYYNGSTLQLYKDTNYGKVNNDNFSLLISCGADINNNKIVNIKFKEIYNNKIFNYSK